MDKARDQVLAYINQLKNDQPLTTSQLASDLSLSRSVISHYLNDLASDGEVQKIAGRPVRWQRNSTTILNRNTFKNFIGYRGSMRHVISQISAAVLYPPDGLNILITGHSGVGKSYLASKIAKLAKDKKVIKADAPYIVLNCADYANNPELVSSMLFGYVKGAYTGADESKDGLLKQANGGYLFLDEVHRLSSENQEKLFSFIDSGEFYSMGDNVKPIKSKVRLILATTEDPEKVLLTTFLRRIPVHVNLPDFIKRPIDERLELLRYLFYQEAQTINKKIEVDKYVVSALLQIKHTGNIGYLKNVIQVSCAAAYNEQAMSDVIRLEMSNLMLTDLPRFEDYSCIFVDPQKPLEHHQSSLIQRSLKDIENQLEGLQENYSHDAAIKCKLAIQGLKQFVPEWVLKSGLHLQHQGLFNKVVQKQFGLGQTGYLEPVLYLLYSYHFEIDEKIIQLLNEKFSNLIPRALHVARTFYKKLPQLTEKSDQSLILILALLLSDHVDENIQLRGLMVAHGHSTATSIQTVVNSLCGTYIFDAIDMPVDTGVELIIEETKKLISSFNTTNGFILMVDMGSLSQLYSEISSHLDGDLLVVNNLTTLTALDLALKMQQNQPFKQIAQNAESEYGIEVQYYEGFSQSPNILISCISGLGIAETVSKIIQPFLPSQIKVIPVDYASLKEKIKSQDWSYFDRTLFVLTTLDILEPVGFKHMNLYSLLDASGENNLKKWLAPYMASQEIETFSQQILRFFSKEGISERLSFLNPDVVIRQVEEINSKYESYYGLNLDGKVKLNLYMHIALMIERLMVQKTAEIKVEPKTEQEKDFFNISHSIFQPVEMKYNIKISNYEISLLYELFRQFIEAKL